MNIPLRSGQYPGVRDWRKKNGFFCFRQMFTGYHSVTSEARVFFIELYVVNPGLSPDCVVFGQRPDNQRNRQRPSYVLVKAGFLGPNAKQIHNFYPVKEAVVRYGQLDVQVGSCKLSPVDLSGSVSVEADDAEQFPECMTDAGQIFWDLRLVRPFDEKKPFYRRLPRGWAIYGFSSAYSGRVVADGEEYLVKAEKSFGYLDCVKGRDFSGFWLRLCAVQLSSQFSSKKLENSCLLVYSLPGKTESKIRAVSVLLFLNGRRYVFTPSRIKKVSSVLYSVSQAENSVFFTISASSFSTVLDIRVQLQKADLVNIRYETPSARRPDDTVWYGSPSSGELRLFTRKGKSLELMEHAVFEPLRCEVSRR